MKGRKGCLATVLACFTSLLLFIPHASAEIDCNAKCCKTIRVTPLDKNHVCAPACKANCESSKRLGVDPNVTDVAIDALSPNLLVDVEKALNMGCAAAFEVINRPVILYQGPHSAGSSALLEQAKQILITLNLVRSDEFQNVAIRWAKLVGAGQAPDRNIVLINEDYLTSNDLLKITSTLLHEMVHVRQYRRMGTDDFKCKYVRAYIGNAGDQGQHHFLEREAYAVEEQNFASIRDHIATTLPRRRFQGEQNPALIEGQQKTPNPVMGCGRDNSGRPIVGARVDCN